MEADPRAHFMRRALEAADRARAQGAPIVPSIAAAQAALESRYGESRLARDANNLFGIKASKSWHGDFLALPGTEYIDGQIIGVAVRWRLYPSWEACFNDYGSIIDRLPWFADAAAAARANDASGFLAGLIADPHGPGAADDEPGWATDPEYQLKVWGIARQWGLVGDAVVA